MIEIAVTPNRPDCARRPRHRARSRGRRARQADRHGRPAGARRVPLPGQGHARFRATRTQLCPAFALRLVRGVKNGPSPEWLQRRLRAIGLQPDQRAGRHHQLPDLRPQPAAARLRRGQGAGRSRGAPRAATAKSSLALDGKTYALDRDHGRDRRRQRRRIARRRHGRRALRLRRDTTDVLIESALWDPLNIARTGRALGINSDARYRFERGVDPGLHACRGSNSRRA